MEYASVCRYCNACFVNNSWRFQTINRRINHNKSYSSGVKTRPLLAQTNPSFEAPAKEQGSQNVFCFEEMTWPSPSDEIPFWKNEFPLSGVSPQVPDVVEKDMNPMYIIHVTAEMAPIAKVGGLGDVVTGLARACLSRGHTVDIMLPFYECIPKEQIHDLTLITAYNSYHDGTWVPTKAYRGVVSSIPVIFVEPFNQFFKGKFVYGGSYNELEAYLFFSRACLEWMQVTGTQPDIIHVHEWQTGALPLLYWDMYHNLSLWVTLRFSIFMDSLARSIKTDITAHKLFHFCMNMNFVETKNYIDNPQHGALWRVQVSSSTYTCHPDHVGRKEQLSKCGLDGFLYGSVEKAIDDRTIGHNPERLSLLKGGIVYSNAVILSNISEGDTFLWMAFKHIDKTSR